MHTRALCHCNTLQYFILILPYFTVSVHIQNRQIFIAFFVQFQLNPIDSKKKRQSSERLAAKISFPFNI